MLSFTKKTGGFLAAAALAIGFATAAPAATLSWSARPATSTPNPLATSSAGTVIENVAGTVAAVRLSPWAGLPTAATNVFTSVSRGFAEYTFTTLKETLSFVWGSPNTFNSVEFYRAGTLIDTIPGFGTGQNIAMSSVLATNIGDGMGFDSLFFRSTGVSFEYASLKADVAPVPVPAAGLLLLTAVGGVAALRRRKSA